ncbi:response regulator transcription factor [Variovorax sp. J22R133]|uniref:response regulator transcription factor n=1 Tax=Variovorax brevis TaxID=3053503 RepID=UPI002576DE43|nr:response regulator transcription factor [Variovorax sp. J22R133]MDM0116636.1 response regulator transcription factor [Variovorax sp. J22R133]
MTETRPISVLVVDDDEFLLAEFVDMVLATEALSLAGSAISLATARAWMAKDNAPDVAVIDLGLPDGSGTEIIRELLAMTPQVAVLVITVFGDEDHLMQALEAGATGYLLKECSQHDFEKAIRQVHAGESPLSAAIARHLLKRLVPAFPSTPVQPGKGMRPIAGLEALSKREIEILSCIANGHSVPEAAALLSLSRHTVSTHVKNIYEKLAVNNRTQAVNRARATGQLR